MQLLLAVLFVCVVAFRSIVPRTDIQRFTLIDSWFASVFVGRSAATIAELAFVLQWVFLLRAFARKTMYTNKLLHITSYVLVPLIAIAEVWSWSSVLTTSYFGNIIEESLWLVAGILLVVSMSVFWAKTSGIDQMFLRTVTILGLTYVVYMVAVDVPMYIQRWQTDQSLGRQYYTFMQGVGDALTNKHVTFAWEDWRDEVAWMSFYFTAGAWVSMAMVFIPRPKKESLPTKSTV